MAACLVVFSFGTFACALVPNIPVFATLRFLTGVAAAAVVPMSLGYIGDKFPYQDRQIALGAVHERVDDRPDCRQHAGRDLRSIPWLALCLRRLRHRRARRVGHAGARGASISGAANGARGSGSAIFTVPLGGSLIFVGLLGVLPIAAATALEARRCLLGYALATRIRRHPDAAHGTRGPRHGDARRRVRLRRAVVSGLVLTDRFGINYAYAGLMVAGFGCGGLVYSVSARRLVTGVGGLASCCSGACFWGSDSSRSG